MSLAKPDPARTPRKRASGGEKALQGAITNAAHAYGYASNHVYRMRTEAGVWRTSTTAVGWPDLMFLRGMWGLTVEVKGARGVVEDEQLVWLARFALLPAWRSWVLRPADDEHLWQAWLRDPEHAPRRYGWTAEQAAEAAERIARRAANKRQSSQ